MHPDLDRADLRILDLVQEHGHFSAAEVAERLGMTASTCWRRISRLEELGVIGKRVALLDREKLGLSVMVFSHVKLAGHGRDALLRFEQAVRIHPEILECYTLMGETDFLLRIVCRDIKAYEAFFLDHLSRFPGVQSVNSSIALAVIKETTALPLREAVHHFKASLGLIAIDALMGHPRPVRPTMENSSIPFTQAVGSQITG